jgi:hypothetical protein
VDGWSLLKCCRVENGYSLPYVEHVDGKNDRNFKNQEKTLEELAFFFFFCLFSWTAACLAPLVISFTDFFVLFSPST